MATRTLNLDEDHEVSLLRGALADRLKTVLAEQMLLAVTRKRDLHPFERQMLPIGLREMTTEELQEQINPWITLCDYYRHLLEMINEPITPTMEEVLADTGGGRVLTNVRPLSDYTRRWPQACAELSGFVKHLKRTNVGITADQISMACELAEMRYRQMVTEVKTGQDIYDLLQAVRQYAHHYIDIEEAKINGFDVEAWLVVVDALLSSEKGGTPNLG